MSHDWRYFKAGGIIQVSLENGDDLRALKDLDRKTWTALAASVKGLRLDARTLAFLDADGDGRIRWMDVLEALAYLEKKGVDLDKLFVRDPEDEKALADVTARQAALDAEPPSEADKAALAAWEEAGKSVSPLGEKTADAVAALAAVESVIDAFFTVPDDLPLVTEDPDKSLPLFTNLNPKWAEAIRTFAEKAAAPALGEPQTPQTLARRDWAAVKAFFAPYRTWAAAKPVVAADAKAKLEETERTLRYKMHLVTFLRNFVNQAALYSGSEAMYQTGVLYVDGRACRLCFDVEAEGAHAALAAKSKCCLVYAKLTRAGASRTVCAVVTAGRTATLFAGRNAVFTDRDGTEWDATVTKVVEEPVSLAEAFWTPWTKLFGSVSEFAKKFLGQKQTSATANLDKLTANPANAGANGAAVASSVAALGIGIGMLGTAFAALMAAVAGLPLWKVMIGVVGVVLAVSLPSVALAWFKLRARDLGAILNAGGWAVNRPLRLSPSRAKRFTEKADLGWRFASLRVK